MLADVAFHLQLLPWLVLIRNHGDVEDLSAVMFGLTLSLAVWDVT